MGFFLPRSEENHLKAVEQEVCYADLQIGPLTPGVRRLWLGIAVDAVIGGKKAPLSVGEAVPEASKALCEVAVTDQFAPLAEVVRSRKFLRTVAEHAAEEDEDLVSEVDEVEVELRDDSGPLHHGVLDVAPLHKHVIADSRRRKSEFCGINSANLPTRL